MTDFTPIPEHYFVFGGIKSGKSSFAVERAKESRAKICFIATATPSDEEMEERIKKHQENRPANWGLLEAPIDLPGAIAKAGNSQTLLLVDCIGIWISNLLLEGKDDQFIMNEAQRYCDTLEKCGKTVITVSNDVGCCLVPDNKLGRRFCDLLGMINQKIAACVPNVVYMQAGFPTYLKGKQNEGGWTIKQ